METSTGGGEHGASPAAMPIRDRGYAPVTERIPPISGATRLHVWSCVKLVHAEERGMVAPAHKVTPAAAGPHCRAAMNGKPVIVRQNARKVLDLDKEEFGKKQLCDGAVLNLGDTCAYGCEFCYAAAAVQRYAQPVVKKYNRDHGTRLDLRHVVVRRKDAINLLRTQLVRGNGQPRFGNATDNRVVFASSLVDPGPNLELLRETADACNLILEHTHWRIRLLSKSSLIPQLVKKKWIQPKHLHRVIFGFSTGTLDDKLAAAIETNTSLVSKRLEALHWLQGEGLKTFGMICPSLPQEDYDEFSRGICAAIRADRCEHVWAEVINLRGDSFDRTIAALRKHGHAAEAERLAAVSGEGAEHRWNDYARKTFMAHAKHVPKGKLRFLQYVTKDSYPSWKALEPHGAVLLGVASTASSGPEAKGESPPAEVVPKTAGPIAEIRAGVVAQLVEEARTGISADEQQKRAKWEDVVRRGLGASVEAAKALYLIKTYREGVFWNTEYESFEAYCAAKWDYRKTHAYRLVAAGEFIVDLEHSPIGESADRDWFPRNESQIRPLLALPDKDARIQCWREALEGKSAAELTGKKVASKTRELARETGLRLHDRKRPDPRRAARGALDRLERTVKTLKENERITRLIDEIRILL